MFKLPDISARIIGLIAGTILLLLAVGLFVRSCDKRRAIAAQTRLERAQGDAAANSAADAVNTVARSGEAQAASEDLGRKNAQDIQAADGAKVPAGAGVNAAGRAALCKRKAYQNEPMCKGARP